MDCKCCDASMQAIQSKTTFQETLFAMPLQQRKAQIAVDASADAKNKERAINLVDKFPKMGSH